MTDDVKDNGRLMVVGERQAFKLSEENFNFLFPEGYILQGFVSKRLDEAINELRKLKSQLKEEKDDE